MKRVSKGVYRVTYPRAGVYTFEYTARDNDGLTAIARISITVRKGNHYCYYVSILSVSGSLFLVFGGNCM